MKNEKIDRIEVPEWVGILVELISYDELLTKSPLELRNEFEIYEEGIRQIILDKKKSAEFTSNYNKFYDDNDCGVCSDSLRMPCPYLEDGGLKRFNKILNGQIEKGLHCLYSLDKILFINEDKTINKRVLSEYNTKTGEEIEIINLI